MAKVKMGAWEYTKEELEQMFDAATRRGEVKMRTEAQAKSVSYDRQTNHLIIELKNGATFIIPCGLIQGLRDADPERIAEVELSPRGAALHWERLDQDYSVAGLLAGIFGTKAWMAEMRRKGGHTTSKAKTTVSRTNGQKGNRTHNEPKKRKSA